MTIGAAGNRISVGQGDVNYSIQSELRQALGSPWNINQTTCRTLTGTSSGAPVSFSTFYGKSFAPANTATTTITNVWSNAPTQMQVLWAPVAGAEHYYMQRWASDTGWVLVGFAYTNGGTDTGLVPNKEYYWAVTAFVGGSYGPYSTAVRGRTLSTAPSSVSGTVLSRTTGRIDWAHSSDATPPTKYQIFAKKSTESAYNYTLLAEVAYPTTSYTASPLFASTTYNFWVGAVNADGVLGLPSNVGSATTWSTSSPTITALNGNAPNDGVSVIITVNDYATIDRQFYVTTYYRVPPDGDWQIYQSWLPLTLYAGQSSGYITVYANPNNVSLREIRCELRDYQFPWVADTLSNTLTKYL